MYKIEIILLPNGLGIVLPVQASVANRMENCGIDAASQIE